MKQVVLRKIIKTTAGLCLCLIFILLSLSGMFYLFPFPEQYLEEQFSHQSTCIMDKTGKNLLAWYVSENGTWKIKIPLNKVSLSAILATLAAEDKRFWKHPGVDFYSLFRAAFQNLAKGRRFSGASTITMQVIRMLWPRERSYGTKLIEIFRALQLERIYSKEKILEIYFNIAPYGGNICGIEAASQKYFNKKALDLNLNEAALLAGLPQAPTRYDPCKRLPNAMKRRDYVLKRMLENSFISPEEYRQTLKQNLKPAHKKNSFFSESHYSIHFSEWIRQITGKRGGIIQTTLDYALQHMMIEYVKDKRHIFDEKGIDGYASVILRIEDSSVAAMIGSLNPSHPLKGFVNAALTKRQPGSLLKPFIYARSFSQGFLTPASILYDLPMSWNGYHPSNSDHSYLGIITAKDALLKSRNIPAVTLLKKIGVNEFAKDLSHMGLNVLSADKRLGLSLALGTEEMKLTDLANAYAVFPRKGLWKPLKIFAEEPENRGIKIYTEGASYLTLRSLGISGSGEEFKPGYKTGTSWNHRDAWAMVLTPEYVIGVWCGRLSGEGQNILLGAEIALPIAMEIQNLISLNRNIGNWKKPSSVCSQKVCALSGALPSHCCDDLVMDERISGVSSEAVCSIHRLNPKTHRVEAVFPENVRNFLSKKTDSAIKPRLTIRFPVKGSEYLLQKIPERSELKKMECIVDADYTHGDLYWFLDGKLYDTTTKPICFISLEKGAHILSVSDADGHSDQVNFMITQMD